MLHVFCAPPLHPSLGPTCSHPAHRICRKNNLVQVLELYWIRFITSKPACVLKGSCVLAPHSSPSSLPHSLGCILVGSNEPAVISSQLVDLSVPNSLLTYSC